MVGGIFVKSYIKGKLIMNSEIDTKEHIFKVRGLLTKLIDEINHRWHEHDKSKLVEPEKEILDKWTPLLKDSTYGSEEYYAMLKEMKVGIDHHYINNRHHPEFHERGMVDMNLIDLIELICDWIAASERHKNGNVFKSIELNQERFGYPDQLKQIFINTANFIISKK